MLDMRTIELLGEQITHIAAKYGDREKAAFIVATMDVDRVEDLAEPYRGMVLWALERAARAEQGQSMKKAMTYHQTKGHGFLAPGAVVPGKTAKSYVDVRKYNPYHRGDGKFSSKNGFSSYSIDRKIKKPWGENNSLVAHMDPATGKLSKERAAQYNEIINGMIGGVQPPSDGKPTMDFMGGGGGSGKGYTISAGVVQVPGEKDAAYINSDDVKMKFEDFRTRAASGDETVSLAAANYIHEESSIVASAAMRAAAAKGVNIVLDGTANNPDKVAGEVAAARANGYTTRAHYVATPMDVAIQSNIDRYYSNPNREERRMVPTEKLVEAHVSVSKNFARLADLYDEVEVVTNDHKSAPVRIAHKEAGGPLVITDQSAMAEFIGKQNYKLPEKPIQAC